MRWLSKKSQSVGGNSQRLIFLSAKMVPFKVAGDLASSVMCPSHLELLHGRKRPRTQAQLCPSDIRSESWDPLAFRGGGWHYPRPSRIFNRLTFCLIWINQSVGGALSCWVGEMEKWKKTFSCSCWWAKEVNFEKEVRGFCRRNLLREKAVVVPLPWKNIWPDLPTYILNNFLLHWTRKLALFSKVYFIDRHLQSHSGILCTIISF